MARPVWSISFPSRKTLACRRLARGMRELTCSAAICSVMLCGCSENDEWEPDSSRPMPWPHSEEQPKDFWMNGLSIKHINGDQIRFEMTATKVIHRHRVTPLIHYENFDEIWVESLNAVMPMAGGSNSNIHNHASSRRNCKEGSDPRKGGECLVGAAHTVRSAAKDMTQNQHDAPASIRFPLRDLAEEFKAINHSWVTEVTRGDGASHGHDVRAGWWSIGWLLHLRESRACPSPFVRTEQRLAPAFRPSCSKRMWSYRVSVV